MASHRSPWLRPVWQVPTVVVVVVLAAAAMSVASVELLISEAGWVGFTHPVPRFPVLALA